MSNNISYISVFLYVCLYICLLIRDIFLLKLLCNTNETRYYTYRLFLYELFSILWLSRTREFVMTNWVEIFNKDITFWEFKKHSIIYMNFVLPNLLSTCKAVKTASNNFRLLNTFKNKHRKQSKNCSETKSPPI